MRVAMYVVAGWLLMIVLGEVSGQTCPSPQFAWSSRCWYRRDTGSVRAGPGNNIFSSSLATVAPTGFLQLGVAKSGGKWVCSEVFLSESLGYGDYVFVVESDPTLVNKNLVFAPFLYKNDTAEIDIEFSTWGGATVPNNAQYVLQPYSAPGALHRFVTPSAQYTTHRIRWAGPSSPSQVAFESWAPGAGGAQTQSYQAAGGSPFEAGGERVHFNLWIYSGGRPSDAAANYMRLACFASCPIDLATGAGGCVALGSKPTCANTAGLW